MCISLTDRVLLYIEIGCSCLNLNCFVVLYLYCFLKELNFNVSKSFQKFIYKNLDIVLYIFCKFIFLNR